MKKLLIWEIILVLLLSGCGTAADENILTGEASTESDTDIVETAADSNDDSACRNENNEDQNTEPNTIRIVDEDITESTEASERKYFSTDFTPIEDDHTVTLMVYMVGSDLESKGGAATNDMQEMIDSGVDLTKVNLLVYAGGATKWFSDISDSQNGVYRLTEDGFIQVAAFEQKSMGEPDSLSEFLDYSFNNYKTDSYNLIFWDHGNGPVMGYGKDKIFDGDSLTLPELSLALGNSPFNENNKLNFIGFDACLMASAELACTLSDYAKIMISSQEVEPNFGWNYEFLDRCGQISDESLAQYVVSDYVSYCEQYFAEHENFCADITLSAVDLEYTDELEQAINSLFEKAIDDVSGGFGELAVERFNSRALGRATSGSEYDLVDIANLMSCMSEAYPKETRAVQELLDKMVVSDGYNTNDCCGMSLYYPYFNKKHYSKAWKEGYAQIGLFDSYVKYLSRYEQVWLGTEMSEFFMEPMTPEEYTPGVYSLTLNDDQLEHYVAAGFYILQKYGDGVYCEVSYSRDVTLDKNTIIANYDGRTLMISDDYGKKSVLPTKLTDINGDKYYYSVYQAAKNGSDPSYMSASDFSLVPAETELVVDHASNQVEVGGFYMRLEEDEDNQDVNSVQIKYLENDTDDIQTGKKKPLDLEKYVILSMASRKPKYLTRDDNGILKGFSEWKEYGVVHTEFISVENGMHFTYEPYYSDGSEYFLMFDIIDAQNNHYSSELMPIAVAKAPDEEGVDVPINEIDWEEGQMSAPIESAGVELQFFEAKAPDRIDMNVYGIFVNNSNDFSINICVNDIMLNDEYQIQDKEYVFVPAGQNKQIIFEDIEQALRFAGGDKLKTIQFSYSVSDAITEKYYAASEKVRLSVSDSISPEITVVPLFKAQADAQTPVSNTDFSIELLDLGNYLGTDSYNSDYEVKARLRIANSSDTKLSFAVQSAYINGYLCFLSSNTLENGETTLQSNTSSDMYLSFSALNSVSFGNEINSVVLNLTVTDLDGKREILSFPLELSSCGNTDVSEYEPSEPVYRDEYIEVYDAGLSSGADNPNGAKNRLVIVKNISDANIGFELNRYDSSYDSFDRVWLTECPYDNIPLKSGEKIMFSLESENTAGAFNAYFCDATESMTFNITVYDEAKEDPEFGFYLADELYTTTDFEFTAIEE